MAWSSLVDLAITDEDRAEAMEAMAPAARPQYPYGCCIRLTSRELSKLDLDTDVDVGDMIDMRAFGTVTSVNKSGEDCCVEIQLEKIALESEMDEEDMPERPARRYRKR